MSERYCPNCGEYHDMDLTSTCRGAIKLKRNLSTQENRDFWAVVDEAAKRPNYSEALKQIQALRKERDELLQELGLVVKWRSEDQERIKELEGKLNWLFENCLIIRTKRAALIGDERGIEYEMKEKE